VAGLPTTPALATGDTVQAAGPLVAFSNPYGDGRENPAAGGSAGVHATATGNGRMIVTLHVNGVAPTRAFGAHVHVGTCAQKGLGHYMHDAAAGATPHNEVWLDLVTNAAGNGHSKAKAEWVVRPGQAHSVVLHDRTTDARGAAGPKLACLDVDF
jgi:Cu-Zn family superoxide dismutase